MEIGEPRLRHQIRGDFWSFFLSLAIVVPWAVLLVVLVAFGLGGLWLDRATVLEVAVAVGLFSLSCGALLVWRTAWVRSLFACGVLVPGRLEPGSFEPEGISRFLYRYDWQGWRGHKVAWVIQSERTQQMLSAPDVRVVVDPASPHRACLRDLYVA